ncbi:MAG TPA: 4Fe-4S binding protein [Anaerolineae bacterium]|nr:4Fe-4S binding protein [Anaerolineae bacterium]
MEDVYQRLARHLDNLPGGFPATESGVELRILRRLFTEQEAALAVNLTFISEPVEVIAERVDRDVEEVAAQLEAMSRKGLIFRRRKGGVPLYSASQFVVGIWEYHVNDLDPELIHDVNEYLPHLFQPELWREVPQLRTIPVGESVTVEHEILAYEQAENLVRERERIAVAPCICRREHQMIGEGCDKPMETCLVFGTGADYYVENGLGRYIEVDEALEILRLAEESGLVLQPSNSQRIVNICCCCGCCCQVLLALKRLPKPASLVSSPYVIAYDPDLCVGCGDCVTRCQMDALSLVGDVSVPDLDRCIGCGLCVTTCTSGSLHLVRKPLEEQAKVPSSLARTYVKLARVRGVM